MGLLLLLLGAAPAGVPTDERAQGEAAWEAGDHAAALTHWGLALEAARTNGEARNQVDLLIRIAAVHRELGRISSATAFLDAADKLAPSDGGVTIARRLVALDSGDATKAESLFSSAFKATKTTDPRLAMDAAVDLGLARAARLGKNGRFVHIAPPGWRRTWRPGRIWGRADAARTGFRCSSNSIRTLTDVGNPRF